LSKFDDEKVFVTFYAYSVNFVMIATHWYDFIP
jgi:hypothetical protein